MAANNFEIKKEKVLSGQSQIFNNWHDRAGITVDEFLEGLRWLCEDPENGGPEGNRCTRELACVAEYDICDLPEDDPFYSPPVKQKNPGLHKLRRVHREAYDEKRKKKAVLTSFYYEETHEVFLHSCTHVSISSRDRI